MVSCELLHGLCRVIKKSIANDNIFISLLENGRNVFLDALAWHVVTRLAAEASTPPPVYVITSGATEEMPITMEDFEDGTFLLDNEKLENFTMSLAQSFLGAGEAKWWDAQVSQKLL